MLEPRAVEEARVTQPREWDIDQNKRSHLTLTVLFLLLRLDP